MNGADAMTYRLGKLLACLLLLAGCAAISAADKATLAQPPNCADPEGQIASLEALRPSQFKKARVMAGYVAPDGLIGGAIHNDFADRKSIVNGSYQRKIDARIAEIRLACK